MLAVCAHLEEADLDVPDDPKAALTLPDGRQWGVDRNANPHRLRCAWAERLGLPHLPASRCSANGGTLTEALLGWAWSTLTDEKLWAAVDHHIPEAIEGAPANSLFGRFAQAAARVLGAEVSRRTEAASS